MRKQLFAIILTLVIAMNIISCICLCSEITSVFATPKNGHIIIKVLESNTLEPVLNANVCIVETRTYTTTNKSGYTPKLTIPIIPNNNFDISLKRDWGEFTILVYKKGYTTFISFYNVVYPNTTNVGLICYLSPIINADDPIFITNVTKPDDTWIYTLINLYKV